MIYNYLCVTCGEEFHRVASVEEYTKEPKSSCPNCGSEKTMREINNPPVHFKGSGFYTTDKDEVNS